MVDGKLHRTFRGDESPQQPAHRGKGAYAESGCDLDTDN